MFPRKLVRTLSALMAVLMLLVGPWSVTRAEAFPGVKTIAVGGAVGTAVAIGAKVLMGAIGLGAASMGLPAIALAGGLVGAAVTTFVGNRNPFTTDTAKSVGLGAAAAGATGVAMSAGGLLLSPWILLPAAAIGVGTAIWAYFKSRPNYGAPGDIRNRAGFSDPFFNPQFRVADRSQVGYYGEDRSVLDRIRNVFDRNRRDDNFYAGTTVMPDGTLRQQSDLFGRLGQFFGGTSDMGRLGGGAGFYGPGYGNSGYFSPGANPQTDRIGRITVGGGVDTRNAFSRFSDENRFSTAPASPTGSDRLETARKAKDSAYQALVGAVAEKGSGSSEAAAALEAFRQASKDLEAAQSGMQN